MQTDNKIIKKLRKCNKKIWKIRKRYVLLQPLRETVKLEAGIKLRKKFKKRFGLN